MLTVESPKAVVAFRATPATTTSEPEAADAPAKSSGTQPPVRHLLSTWLQHPGPATKHQYSFQVRNYKGNESRAIGHRIFVQDDYQWTRTIINSQSKSSPTLACP